MAAEPGFRPAAYSRQVARTDRPNRPTTARKALPSLRASTRRAMRPSGPPTDEIPIWTAPDGVDRETARAVIDLAMRAPLLPGRMAYEGISQIVTNPDGNGLALGLPTLLQAFGIGLGLAAGVSLGTYFAGLLGARRQGVRPRPAAGATLSADPDRQTAGDSAPLLSDTGELPTVRQPGTLPVGDSSA